MKEIYPGIFHQTIKFEDKHALPRNIFLIYNEERSLLIDTTYRYPHAWIELNQMLLERNIDYKKLDVFITHNHPDHIGYVYELQQLGARVYMNPEEAELKTDILQCYLSMDATQYVNLRSMGLTKERYPYEYDTIVMNLSRKLVEREEPYTFDYTPVSVGDKLTYGDYTFEVVDLKGHTVGQCGLYDEEHKILFSGDQVVKGTIPIVMSQKRNLHLLRHYYKSLYDMKKRYKGCLIFPCHCDMIENIEIEVNQIIDGYQKQCDATLDILKKENDWMVIRDIGAKVYGGRYFAFEFSKVTLCAHIWSKTYACLEYLLEEGKVKRKEVEGTMYWKII